MRLDKQKQESSTEDFLGKGTNELLGLAAIELFIAIDDSAVLVKNVLVLFKVLLGNVLGAINGKDLASDKGTTDLVGTEETVLLAGDGSGKTSMLDIADLGGASVITLAEEVERLVLATIDRVTGVIGTVDAIIAAHRGVEAASGFGIASVTVALRIREE